MTPKSSIRLATIAAGAFVAVLGWNVHLTPAPAYAACDPQDKVDHTTVEDTRKKVLAAGYQKPTNFRKGCDSYWHLDALKDGQTVHVVVSPAGEVMTERD